MKVTKRKVIKDNGYAIVNIYSDGDIVFFADIPQNAVVDAVKVGDRFLDDILSSDVKYPRTLKEDTYRVVAVVNNGRSDTLYDEVEASTIESFEVYYHEEAILTV